MKKTLKLWTSALMLVLAMQAMAQDASVSSDSLEYEMQRQKVNALLDERIEKFGQYDESLRKKTGIFGFKTKRDMQASLDILLQIVKTDNNIFHETKNLLNYKDQMLSYESFEKNKVKQIADDYDQRIDAYIRTISKLQNELENHKTENAALRTRSGIYSGLTFLFFALGIGFFVYRFFNKQKLTKL